jgi:methylmalonyl-CoA mutase
MADTTAAGTEALRIREEFPPVTTAEWEAAIQADLKGGDYDRKLIWRTEEGIAVRPYYRRDDLAGIESPDLRGSGSQDWRMAEPGAEIPEGAIRGDLLHDNGATAIQELGYAIAEGVERLAAADGLTFVFGIGTNFFFEIAKLRAARLLWARKSPSPMNIYARTALADKSIYDPYTNLLRATTQALSAAIGGCDTLEVRPFGFSYRLAMNVQRILREESHMHRVADPAAGSYYIESLTDSIAREAWKVFQQVEAQGGYAAAKQSIDAAVAESRAAREKAIASRRKVRVGVNNYPNVGETADDVKTGAGWREAAGIEAIRRRTAAHAKATGKRPKILLLSRGDLKMRQARAQFCLNFFGCGGFDIVESDQFEGTDAALIVLCSSDPEYLPLASEVCSRVEQPVIVAGNPKDQTEALNAAGVAGYVHVLSNLAETLTEWQKRLGIGGDL